MRKIVTILFAAAIFLSISVTSFAGEWKQETDGRYWYQNDDGSYPVNQWKEIDGKKYYFDENGYMLSNTITPDGEKVGEDGAHIPSTQYRNGFDNEVDDVLSFEYNGEIVEIPCKIYYNDYRIGTYTKVRYDSVKMEKWNGKNANLLINYTVEKNGGYKSTYYGCDLYINEEFEQKLGGKYGNERLYFNKDSTYLIIPTDNLTPNDLVELCIIG